MCGLRWLLIVLALIPSACGMRTALLAEDRVSEIQMADVFVLVTQLTGEIEQLRREMGKPASEFPFEVRNAAPREVYFQALTLFRKSDRLAFEQLRERVDAPAEPSGPLHPKDVLAVVEAAQQRIRQVKGQLKIDEPVATPDRDAAKTPTDVFRAIVKANQQLNVLLDQPFAPSDVFQQVQRASGLATVLASRFNAADFPNEPPEFQRGKSPSDVYRQLLACFKQIRKILEALELKTLEFEISEETVDRATPSDVYDLASVMVAELAYLRELYPSAKLPPKVFYPGRKFPSHVHQAARLLEQQLDWLQHQFAQHPDGPTRETTP